MRKTNNYVSEYIKDRIIDILPTRSGYEYLGEKQSYFSKYLTEVPYDVDVMVEVRVSQFNGVSYFLKATAV